MRKPVRRGLSLVLGYGQVMSNYLVSDDFALALELERLGRWTSWPIAFNAGSGIWAEGSSCPTRVASLAHLASN